MRPPNSLIRACNVRTFSRDLVTAGLPTGYDRAGAGNSYYFVPDSSVEQSTATPQMTEGLDLIAPAQFEKLVGLGIFCGGGNFDRGFEDAGRVEL